MLRHNRRSWYRRAAIVAAIVVPSFFVGQGAQAAKYQFCVPIEPIWLLGSKIQLCIPIDY